jgi:hypothetical protein
MKRKLPRWSLAVVVSTVAVPLFAHHGNAAYNYDKKITVSGTVTEWIWANPHCWLKFDARDENGEVKHWVVEASAPPTISAQGWSHNSFKPGDQVTVTMIQVKNGQAIGRFEGDLILNGKPFPRRVNGSSENGKGDPKPKRAASSYSTGN